MLDNIDKVKDRINSLNTGFKGLKKFSEVKSGEMFSKMVDLKTNSASTSALNTVIKPEILNDIKEDLNQIISKYSKIEDMNENKVKEAIIQLSSQSLPNKPTNISPFNAGLTDISPFTPNNKKLSSSNSLQNIILNGLAGIKE